MKLICPVSGTENEDREECKQCGTDLRPLIQLSNLPDFSFREGVQCLECGQLLEAVERLSTAVSLSPNSAEIHWKLAEAFNRLGLPQPALSHLDQALALAPERADIRDMRRKIVQAQVQMEAIDESKRVLARRNQTLLWYVPMGALLLGISLTFLTQKTMHRLRQQPKDEVPVQQEKSIVKEEPQPLKLNIAVPGVTLKSELNKSTAIFDSGLFDRGSIQLTKTSKQLLSEFGNQLKPYSHRISVHVIGYTDNAPMPAGRPFQDNISLGMRRAMVVVDYLRTVTKLPAQIFTISSNGENLTPYPQDSLHRFMNRTAVISVSVN